MDPYKRAVKDYRNSVGVQSALANYHQLVQSVNGSYDEIVKGAGELYGEQEVAELRRAKERLDAELRKYRLSGEIEQSRELEREIREYRELERAIQERRQAGHRLEDMQAKLLAHMEEERETTKRNLDTKSKLIFINEGAIAEKEGQVKVLSTSLFFLVLVAFIFYGSYIGVLSPNAFSWLFTLAVLGYLFTMGRRYFWRSYYRFKFWLIGLFAPGLVAKSCKGTDTNLSR